MKHLLDNYILPFTDDLERITEFRDQKLIFMNGLLQMRHLKLSK